MKLPLAILVLLLGIALQCQPRPTQIAPLQVKACPGGGLPCSFDNPTTPGSLFVLPETGGCSAALNSCNTITDSQGNSWKPAIVVPNYNGIPLQYALNTAGGAETVYFAPGTGWVSIIAEYPPSTGLEKASFGTYTTHNATLGAQNGGSYDTGWTSPVETEEPCELLISWSYNTENVQPGPVVPYVATAGPNFTVRATSLGSLALEDSTSTIPGVYIGSLNWNVSAHWDEGLAAFKYGGCH